MLPFANYHISSPTMRDQNTNNNNKRKKKRRPVTVIGGGGGDDLALVKAAAWAWYQRNEGKPMTREFDLTRTTSRITPRPSRYKLEATKNKIISENRVLAENRISKSSLWYDDHDDNKTLYSHLLDSYKIDTISKRIDDLIPDSFPVSPTSSIFGHDDHDRYYHDYGNDDHDRYYHDYGNDGHGFVERKISCDHSCYGKVNGFVKKVNKRKLWGRLMLIGPATVCGKSDDVDLRASQAGGKTGKVVAAAVALIRPAASSK